MCVFCVHIYDWNNNFMKHGLLLLYLLYGDTFKNVDFNLLSDFTVC